MREWSADAQISMLKWLTDVTDEHPNPTNTIELWGVRKGARELQCVAVYLPTGIEVRLIDGDDFHRTRVVKDAPECEKLSQTWRAALVERGWKEIMTSPTDRLLDLGIELPKLPAPAGNYVHAVRADNLLFLAGKGVEDVIGKVGGGEQSNRRISLHVPRICSYWQ